MSMIPFKNSAKNLTQLWMLFIALLVLPPLPAASLSIAKQVPQKITFDFSTLSEDGLTTPPSGVQSISYEFCIPATASHWAEVQTVDPTAQRFLHSKGRIGCRGDQYLCIGNTHQPQWRTVLLSLARLDYIERIDRFWGE